MIRVNLLPGGKKRKARRAGPSLKLPSIGGVSDPWKLATVLVPILAVLVVAWAWWSQGQEREEIRVALDEAVQDSARFADIRAQTELLRARSDSVTQKVTIIQEIDEGRYVWPHVMDEVARALPDYTWLRSLGQLGAGTQPQLRIQGVAGNNFALTRFMEQLEASPFIRGVTLISTTQVQEQQTGQVVYNFELEASYVQPPLDFLETVPLFTGGEAPEVPAEGEGEPEAAAVDTAASSGTD